MATSFHPTSSRPYSDDGRTGGERCKPVGAVRDRQAPFRPQFANTQAKPLEGRMPRWLTACACHGLASWPLHARSDHARSRRVCSTMRYEPARRATPLVIVLFAGIVSACGSTSPSSTTSDIEGPWYGAIFLTAPAAAASEPGSIEQLSVSFVQNGSALSGMWEECVIVPVGCGPGSNGNTVNSQELGGTMSGMTLTLHVPFVFECSQIQITATVDAAGENINGTWTAGSDCTRNLPTGSPGLSGMLSLSRTPPAPDTYRR